MASENEKIVNDFCKAWSRMNVDELLGFMTDDAVYHNIPMEPAKGKAAIRETINGFLKMAQAFELKILKSAAAGDVVLNERMDYIQVGAKRVEVPVCGVFELRAGKISAWRDYFDLGTWQRQIQ